MPCDPRWQEIRERELFGTEVENYNLEPDPEVVPWCEACQCFSVPNDAAECGECGGDVILREAPR